MPHHDGKTRPPEDRGVPTIRIDCRLTHYVSRPIPPCITAVFNPIYTTPLLPAVINGKHCSALIDSGDSCSLISPRLSPGLSTTKIRTTIHAMNGIRINVTESANIALKVVGETLHHQMVVIPELPWDVILSVDFLPVQKCVLNSMNNTLMIKGKEILLMQAEKVPRHGRPTISSVESQNGPAQLLGQTDSAYRPFVKRLLNRSWDVFAWDGIRLGTLNLVKHRIDTQGATPIRQASRRVPVQSREDLGKIVADMLRGGVVNVFHAKFLKILPTP
ncbi:unnamed protein product [Echinostoma caproni]|uniref:RVP domain-containing protein n=1 Tax=Echinostoma caproni TaxID=27848 RepID=A0A183BFJ8_9TREM|nr:unnamed protein product [Echinostoma caproni]